LLKASAAGVDRNAVEAIEITGEVGTNATAETLRIYRIPQTKLTVMSMQKPQHASLVVSIIKRAQTFTIGDKQKSPNRRVDSVSE
jgi:hypothetical protein